MNFNSHKMKQNVYGDSLVTKLCLTLVTPWTIACQVPVSMGFSRQEYWNGLQFPSPEDLPDPRIKPVSPALAGRFSTTEPPGSPNPTLKFRSKQTD